MFNIGIFIMVCKKSWAVRLICYTICCIADKPVNVHKNVKRCSFMNKIIFVWLFFCKVISEKPEMH